MNDNYIMTKIHNLFLVSLSFHLLKQYLRIRLVIVYIYMHLCWATSKDLNTSPISRKRRVSIVVIPNVRRWPRRWGMVIF